MPQLTSHWCFSLRIFKFQWTLSVPNFKINYDVVPYGNHGTERVRRSVPLALHVSFTARSGRFAGGMGSCVNGLRWGLLVMYSPCQAIPAEITMNKWNSVPLFSCTTISPAAGSRYLWYFSSYLHPNCNNMHHISIKSLKCIQYETEWCKTWKWRQSEKNDFFHNVPIFN
jgi:hypothetical protein